MGEPICTEREAQGGGAAMKGHVRDSLLWVTVKVFFIPMVLISVFLVVGLKGKITSLEYRISELENRKIQLTKEKKELLVKKSDLLSVKNIEHVAMNRLGLAFPDRKRVIYVKRTEMPHNFRAEYSLGER